MPCLPALLLLVLALPACFAPEPAAPRRLFRPPLEPIDAAAPADATAPALRLRATRAAAHLDTRLVYRLSEVELGHHETLRWTDVPAQYVDLALTRACFASGRFRRSLAGDAPLLAVELLGFEELRDADGGARLAFRVLLEDAEGRALLERHYAAEREVAREPADVARALGELLLAQTERLAQDVRAALAPDA